MDIKELKYEHLEKLFPGTSNMLLETYYPHLHSGMLQYAIFTTQRMAGFLAQLGHESGAFRYVEEIASGAAYEGAVRLGNTQPGDGKRFKGRGLIQVTGRSNYTAISQDLGIDAVNNPEILVQPEYAVLSACWYWNKKSLNKICDYPENWTKLYLGKWLTKFEWLTVNINGGLNGIESRKRYYNSALKILTS